MAVFREFDGRGRDRAGEDKRRHRQLVEDSIKRNIGNIIAEESIIGQAKDKKIKIPIRGLKEYQFIYGKNRQGIGSGDGNEKRGDKISSGDMQKGQEQGEAGNIEGEDIYETEITIEQLINYLFEDLELPFLERKRFSELETEKNYKKLGYQRKGIKPRLAKKKSAVERIKREKAYQRGKNENPELYEQQDENERFPFKEDDLRYFRLREEVRRESNAVVICIMDTSGSMHIAKKYLARSFYFLLYQFIRLKYVHVELVFIAHTTVGKEVSEDEFFHKGESGGTYISSGYEKALEVIEKRFNPAIWNIYAFHCSDGDNWSEDNQRAVELACKLCEVCNLFGYVQILDGIYKRQSIMEAELSSNVKYQNFAIANLSRKEEVVPALRKILEKDKELQE